VPKGYNEMIIKFLSWRRTNGTPANGPQEHSAEAADEADVLAYCAHCQTRMFKTADGQWKPISIAADVCQNRQA